MSIKVTVNRAAAIEALLAGEIVWVHETGEGLQLDLSTRSWTKRAVRRTISRFSSNRDNNITFYVHKRL